MTRKTRRREREQQRCKAAKNYDVDDDRDVWNEPILRWSVDRLDLSNDGTASEFAAASWLAEMIKANAPMPLDVYRRVQAVMTKGRPS